MSRSMTGFARVESEGGDPSIEVVVRSVNHRSLDMKIRTPSELEAADPLIRRVVKDRVSRGQLQISISLRSKAVSTMQVDRELAGQYLKVYGELAAEYGVETPPDLNAVLRIPGIVSLETSTPSDEDRAALETKLEATLAAALDRLNEERDREGAGIVADVRTRAESIAAETEGLREKAAELTPKFHERISRRLTELLGDTPVDPQRVAQEAAVLADRTDISEEIQRLAAHAQRLLDLLDQGGEMGKQIDFLAQEMNREANTTLSKSTPLGAEGLSVTEAGLRLKAEIEKIREQAQNLE